MGFLVLLLKEKVREAPRAVQAVIRTAASMDSLFTVPQSPGVWKMQEGHQNKCSQKLVRDDGCKIIPGATTACKKRYPSLHPAVGYSSPQPWCLKIFYYPSVACNSLGRKTEELIKRTDEQKQMMEINILFDNLSHNKLCRKTHKWGILLLV